MRLKDIVRTLDDPSEGIVVDRYTGSKPAMKGMLQVRWDDGGLTWEYPESLEVVSAATPDVRREP
ncbi:MAG: hypothetical protein EOP84_13155 [Verrucomicrobiaceae bacterium]|nr:MAG: hypothetical protein EOP84_13155 [Verrucomicrobiaceae bacterium]